MFVYAYFTKDGGQHIQAFNRVDRATAYVWDQISQYIAVEDRNFVRQEILELTNLKQKLNDCKGKPSLDDATKLIELYEDYCRHVNNNESPLHTLKDIPVVE